MTDIYKKQRLIKPIKVFTFILLSIFIISCDKEGTEPEPEKPLEESGFLKAHFATIADLKIEKATESIFGYEEAPTSRGYIFKPLSDIRMTSVGAMIAEKGTYKISLTMSSGMAQTVQLIDSLVVTDTENFTYKELQNPVILKADSTYTISYFALNHSAVYDAVSPNLQLPLATTDIQIQENYYVYYYRYPPSNQYVPGTWGMFTGTRMRGLVDFIYEKM